MFLIGICSDNPDSNMCLLSFLLSSYIIVIIDNSEIIIEQTNNDYDPVGLRDNTNKLI